jgi:hypothetical protein
VVRPPPNVGGRRAGYAVEPNAPGEVAGRGNVQALQSGECREAPSAPVGDPISHTRLIATAAPGKNRLTRSSYPPEQAKLPPDDPTLSFSKTVSSDHRPSRSERNARTRASMGEWALLRSPAVQVRGDPHARS